MAYFPEFEGTILALVFRQDFTFHSPNMQETVSVKAKNTRGFMIRTTSAIEEKHFRSGNYIKKGLRTQNYSL